MYKRDPRRWRGLTGIEAGGALIPMLLVERRAASTIYAVVYQAGKGNLPDVQLKALGDVDGRLVYQVSGP